MRRDSQLQAECEALIGTAITDRQLHELESHSKALWAEAEARADGALQHHTALSRSKMAIFMSQFEDQNVAIELHLRAGATYRALGDRYREGNSYADASINFERQGDKHRAASYKNRGFAMMLTENRKDGGDDLVGFTMASNSSESNEAIEAALNSHEER